MGGIKGKVTILGSGSSGGVPLATGYWGNCDPANPKNRRNRASIAVEADGKCIIIDTGFDFRAQTIDNNITRVDAVLYTHAHADHINGIDELRTLKILTGKNIPIYANEATLAELQDRFAHVFNDSPDGLYTAIVDAHTITPDMFGTQFEVAGIPLTPMHQLHGTSGASLGFRFGDFAYSTDVSTMPDENFKILQGIKTWVVDCAQYATDFTIAHPNLDIVMGWNERVGASRVILTHLTPRTDHNVMAADLPQGYAPAYDGLTIDIDL